MLAVPVVDSMGGHFARIPRSQGPNVNPLRLMVYVELWARYDHEWETRCARRAAAGDCTRVADGDENSGAGFVPGSGCHEALECRKSGCGMLPQMQETKSAVIRQIAAIWINSFHYSRLGHCRAVPKTARTQGIP